MKEEMTTESLRARLDTVMEEKNVALQEFGKLKGERESILKELTAVGVTEANLDKEIEKRKAKILKLKRELHEKLGDLETKVRKHRNG
jgi:SMC interacting uncharacterized protein involved in chromosome segregation